MKNILEMLEKSAEQFPKKIAFADPEEEISYENLLAKSQNVATYFLKNNIIDPRLENRAVMFFMEKSVRTLPIMFGAVYCNAFYCFVDVRQTRDRVKYIIDTVEPEVIITDEENISLLREYFGDNTSEFLDSKVMQIDFFDESEVADCGIDEKRIAEAAKYFYSLRPLYVNFTSGSTGVPKGVAVGHASVIDFIEVFTKTFNITSEDIFANQAPFDFDVSVKDIYSALYTGAKVQIIPRSYFVNPSLLMDYLCDSRVTTLVWAVTAMCFVSIMNGFSYRNPETINKIMFSGEVMPVKQLNKWKKFLPEATYVNLYGPTEITCNCTYHILDKDYNNDEIIPIGIPFENEKVILVGEDGSIITNPGVEGEICVCGECLALGYFKDPAKTAEAFGTNPANSAVIERMYHTGDLGKYDENSLLYYTSRKDFQIKHMGQRIELGDIEAAAMAVDGVSRACCLYDFDKKKIILIYTGDVESNQVSEALKSKLPPFMAPGKTAKIDDFPVNKNGKIDRKALGEMFVSAKK